MNKKSRVHFLDHKKTQRILKIVIIVIITALIIGIFSYVWHKSAVKKIEGIAEQKQRYLQTQVDSLRRRLSNLRAELDVLKLAVPSYKVVGKVPKDFFKIYGYDAKCHREEVNFYIVIPEELPLLDKLKIVADRLRRYRFQYLPLNILRIENRADKRIAIIEINERHTPYGPTWKGNFFQGSSGGQATTVTLVKTFLQEDYKSEWIDGIEFYYEGKPISRDWDHVSLHSTKYRRK